MNQDLQTRCIESPEYHFIRFVKAVESNDVHTALESQTELRRLGYDVRALKPQEVAR